MRKPTPVTTRHMMTDRASILKPMATSEFARGDPGVEVPFEHPRRRGQLEKLIKMAAAARKEQNMARQATQETRVLEILPPKAPLMMNPRSGKKGISQI